MANRFETPSTPEREQTYTSQFIPLPFEMMQAKADKMQAKYDKVEANIGNMYAAANEGNYIDTDEPAVTAMMNEIKTGINASLEKYNGDYGKLGGIVSGYTNEIASSQMLKGGKNAKQTQDRYKVEMEKSTMPATSQDLLIRGSNKEYEDAGGMSGGAVYDPIKPYDFEPSKFALTSIDKLKADGTSTSGLGVSDDGKFKISSSNSNKSLTKERINKALSAVIWDEPHFNDMVKQEYRALDALGETEGKSIEEYKAEKYADPIFLLQKML